MGDLDTLIKTADEEVRMELFRADVERYKSIIRLRRSLWVRLFPWKITITRRDRLDV